jgi:hypothetical protein
MLEREGLATAKQRLAVIEEQEELIADERERRKVNPLQLCIEVLVANQSAIIA